MALMSICPRSYKMHKIMENVKFGNVKPGFFLYLLFVQTMGGESLKAQLKKFQCNTT